MIVVLLIAAPLYRGLMWAGQLWCHQRPERSPFVAGLQLPLCWRCSGIAAGAAAFLLYLFARRKMPPFGVCVIMALVLPLDVLANYFGDVAGANARRFLTGVLWGIFGTGAGLHLLRYAVARLSPERPQAGAQPLAE